MAVYIDMAPAVLDWLATHILTEDLSPRMRQYLETWISGERRPTLRQLEKFSRSTGVPLGYCLSKTPPHEDLSSYFDQANLGSNPSRNLVDTVYTMDCIQDWLREEYIAEDLCSLTWAGTIPESTPAIEAVAAIRTALHLPADWFPAGRTSAAAFRRLRKTVSDAGVTVMLSGVAENNPHRRLRLEDFRAFVLADDYAPLLFLNSNDSPEALLFLLAQGLVAVFAGHSHLYRAPEDPAPIARFCRETAAELLVPGERFRPEWEHRNPCQPLDDTIRDLAALFHCQESLIAARAADHGFLDQDKYQAVLERIRASQGEGKSKSVRLSGRRDLHFLETVVCSVYEGRTSYTQAFRMTGTHLSSFQDLAARLKYRP